MQTRSVICRARIQGIQDAIAAWQIEHDQAPSMLDIEELVDECLTTHELIRGWLKRAWQIRFSEPQTISLEQTGQALRAVLGAFQGLLPRIGQLAADAAGKGYQINKACQLDAVLTSVQSMLGDLEQRWPFIDHDMIAQSLAEFARGEGISGEEAFRELLGE